MFNLNQTLTLLIPISALIWLVVSIYQLRTKKITTLSFIAYFMIGLLICIMAAFRDGYGFTDSSIIPLSSLLSTMLSILGLSLFVITVVGVLSKNKQMKLQMFMMMILVFVIKFATVEMIVLGQNL
ncbi:MAG TPA: hypothetical protein VFH18_07200 [Erysipelotrichaceae bacterium]|nr:hypothetical protein [Erysipelotrichaceae bacterium]